MTDGRKTINNIQFHFFLYRMLLTDYQSNESMYQQLCIILSVQIVCCLENVASNPKLHYIYLK